MKSISLENGLSGGCNLKSLTVGYGKKKTTRSKSASKSKSKSKSKPKPKKAVVKRRTKSTSKKSKPKKRTTSKKPVKKRTTSKKPVKRTTSKKRTVRRGGAQTENEVETDIFASLPPALWAAKYMPKPNIGEPQIYRMGADDNGLDELRQDVLNRSNRALNKYTQDNKTIYDVKGKSRYDTDYDGDADGEDDAENGAEDAGDDLAEAGDDVEDIFADGAELMGLGKKGRKRKVVKRATSKKRTTSKKPAKKRTTSKKPIKRTTSKKPIKRTTSKKPIKRTTSKKPVKKRTTSKKGAGFLNTLWNGLKDGSLWEQGKSQNSGPARSRAQAQQDLEDIGISPQRAYNMTSHFTAPSNGHIVPDATNQPKPPTTRRNNAYSYGAGLGSWLLGTWNGDDNASPGYSNAINNPLANPLTMFNPLSNPVVNNLVQRPVSQVQSKPAPVSRPISRPVVRRNNSYSYGGAQKKQKALSLQNAEASMKSNLKRYNAELKSYLQDYKEQGMDAWDLRNRNLSTEDKKDANKNLNAEVTRRKTQIVDETKELLNIAQSNVYNEMFKRIRNDRPEFMKTNYNTQYN